MSTHFNIITIGQASETTKALIETTLKELDANYSAVHVANCDNIAHVKAVLTSIIVPLHILITMSEWFDDELEEVREIANRVKPNMNLIMIPPGLKTQQGEKAVVEYLREQITESKIPK